MEKKITSQDAKIKQVFKYLKQFVKEKEEPRKSVGYKRKNQS